MPSIVATKMGKGTTFITRATRLFSIQWTEFGKRLARHTYMHTYISLFKVDKNHNSLLTNKHRLKFLKKYYHISYIYPTLAINLSHKLHGQSSLLEGIFAKFSNCFSSVNLTLTSILLVRSILKRIP